MISIEVDFNSRDDRGWIPVAWESDDLTAGQLVDLFDDDGNHCLATVAGQTEQVVRFDPNWATFAAQGEARFIPTSEPHLFTSKLLSPLSVQFVPRILGVSTTTAGSEQLTKFEPTVTDVEWVAPRP